MTEMTEIPNIVLILADDMGYGDLSCLNEDSKIDTPHMDRIAAEGIIFTDAHASSSVCTPSRYSILTGRYSWRGKLQSGVLGPIEAALIDAQTFTLPQFLQQSGYHTACIGKWHLGMGWPFRTPRSTAGLHWDGPEIIEAANDIDYSQAITDGPIDRGFDYFFGVDASNFPPYCFIENDHTLGIPTLQKPDEMFGHPGPMIEGWDLEELMPELTRKAISYINERAKEEQPFFLYFPSTAPHTPIAPIKKFQGKSQAGAYGDFIMQLDDTIGQIYAALESCGFQDNTLLIVTSDNGSPGRYGSLEAPGSIIETFGHKPNWILRGLKADTWDGGHRVPCVAKWSNHIHRGSTCDELVCLMDLFATFAAILGRELPIDSAEDSFNILPYLLGEKLAEPVRRELVHQAYLRLFGIRKDEWKLIFSHRSGGLSPDPPTNNYDPPQQLYNMQQDIRERENLYFQYPEKVESLTNVFAEHQCRPTAPHTKNKTDHK